MYSPRVVFEVLSPSTEAIDRTEKLAAYRELLSVEDYVLVSSSGRPLKFTTEIARTTIGSPESTVMETL